MGANNYELECNVLRERSDKNNTYLAVYLNMGGVNLPFSDCFCSLSCFVSKEFGVFPSSPGSALTLVTLGVLSVFRKPRI